MKAAQAADEFSNLSVDELKSLLREKDAELREKDIQIQSHRLFIEQLKLQISKLRRLQFGQRTEQRAQEIEQLELWVEALEGDDSVHPALQTSNDDSAAVASLGGSRRREFPTNLPRETKIHEPIENVCPSCGNDLKPLGEDSSEMLEFEPVRFKIIRHVRPKLACRGCDTIVQASAPSRPIERGIAGPGLLAHIIVGKYADHLPLYRQAEMYAREGVPLHRTQLAQWVGHVNRLLAPLITALRDHVFSADAVHADDTPIPVLAPGLGKTKTGRLWTYVRDERPCGGKSAPAVWFTYSANRKGEHPQQHLSDFRGVVHADGYSGYTKVYESGAVREAACWAHARRRFFDLFQANRSEIAAQALDRISELYTIESEIRGKPPDERRAVRQARSVPLLEAMKIWLDATLPTVSQKSAAAEAMKYSLKRWDALMRYSDDGRIEIDNNAAERALRCVALGRKNFLFAGSDGGGHAAAGLYSLIGTAKLNGYNPEAFLREVLSRVSDHPISRIEELLPWNLPALKPGDDSASLPA